MSRRPRQATTKAGFGKDFLELLSIPSVELTALLRLAAQLKVKQRRGMLHPLLPGRMLGLLFQKPSTRTRVSFEAGMNSWGACHGPAHGRYPVVARRKCGRYRARLIAISGRDRGAHL